MHFARALIAAGFLLSATLAAPLLPVKVHDLSARDYNVDKSNYAARSWLDEDGVMAARDLSLDFLEELITRDEDYEADLVARTKGKKGKKKGPTRLERFEKVKALLMQPNALKTLPNQAIFWSGNTLGPKGKPLSAGVAADTYARAHNGKTVAMKLREANILSQMLTQAPSDPHDYSGQLWSLASRLFAQGASGEIHAFLGQNVKPNGVYVVVEKPELIKNPAVSALIEHVEGQADRRAK
ncbi:hypothetical protein BKA70DRAFT_1293876 [Coprinopsis sp. MPI-PUGE-AT-0042]|nr:hypothetical protein BKA70DRAFT_1293876 [Coprinopsis sp. MPI-PUGE-AT-0042]